MNVKKTGGNEKDEKHRFFFFEDCEAAPFSHMVQAFTA